MPSLNSETAKKMYVNASWLKSGAGMRRRHLKGINVRAKSMKDLAVTVDIGRHR